MNKCVCVIEIVSGFSPYIFAVQIIEQFVNFILHFMETYVGIKILNSVECHASGDMKIVYIQR